MHDLFAKYPDAGAGTAARKQALDQVHMNIEWIQTREANLRNALNTKY
jgi:glutamyl aminopeptidase